MVALVANLQILLLLRQYLWSLYQELGEKKQKCVLSAVS